jgi:hypothetical protein
MLKSNKPIIYIGIDPGMNGAIATSCQGVVHAYKMPDGPKAIYSLLKTLKEKHIPVCCVERTGWHFPGNAIAASNKFTAHVAQIHACLEILNISYESIAPQKWMKEFLRKTTTLKHTNLDDQKQRDKLKRKRKNAIKDKAKKLFKDETITLTTSDAYGILWVLMENRKT